ncbi:MAG: hypothetical protein ACYSSI_00320 [Planctomycetota bacterium]|jgi:hypothetical protein
MTTKKEDRKICGNCDYWIEQGFNDGLCDHPNCPGSRQCGYWQTCNWFKKSTFLIKKGELK